VYVNATGRSDVQDEIDRFDDRTAEAFKANVRHLAPTPRSEWVRPKAARLKGFDELYELRFNANNREHRPAGFFGPEPGTFTITKHCIKKQDVYKPADAFRTAEDRRRAILNGQARTASLQVYGEDFPPLPE
jgi:hypothetical protein